MHRFVLYGAFCMVVGLTTWSIVVSSVYRDAVTRVCETVFTTLYTVPENLADWHVQCLDLAQNTSAFESKFSVLQRVQRHMGELNLSHLGVYFPEETKRLWTGLSRGTGIRGRFVGGQFVVSQLLPGSPAEAGGLKVGDSIATINGKSVTSRYQAQRQAGEYRVLRAGKILTFALQLAEVSIDEKPRLEALSASTGMVRISSFRKELFEEKEWKAFAREFTTFRSLILDLRGNPGGNFTAGLRALSPFFCEPTQIGEVVKPRLLVSGESEEKQLPDRITDEEQVAIFSDYSLVPLVTYKEYGCFSGPLVVFIDSETASVAEVVAEGLKLRPQTTVIGRISSGDVLVGVWYDLSLLGKGYSFSVPEAVFRNVQGTSLEGMGVVPDIEMDYKLKDALAGKDSYVLRALKILL